MNEVLSNERTRKALMDSVKQAVNDEQWLEKLAQTSYKDILSKSETE